MSILLQLRFFHRVDVQKVRVSRVPVAVREAFFYLFYHQTDAPIPLFPTTNLEAQICSSRSFGQCSSWPLPGKALTSSLETSKKTSPKGKGGRLTRGEFPDRSDPEPDDPDL